MLLKIKRSSIELDDKTYEYYGKECDEDKMYLLYQFLRNDSGFLIDYEDELRKDLEEKILDSFSFNCTRLLIKDHYFCLRYKYLVEGSEEKKICVLILQEECFRVAREYSEISLKNKWKQMEFSFDRGLLNLKVLEEFE